MNAVWYRVWTLFEEAIERPEPERLAWLAQACANEPEVRREVEKLLAAHQVDRGLLDQPVAPLVDEALADAPTAVPAPDQAGPYRIVGEIGRGGMGVVYKAEDPRLARYVALKFLPPHLLADKKARERFVREAQAASRLDHPNICTIHDIGETEDGRLFFAMAYYEGKTVADRIAQGPLPAGEAAAIATQVARGLQYAHRMGVIHRDIKPSNILLPPDGEAKILDFGLAQRPQSRLSEASARMGTVPYMSPERARGGQADHRVDLWSLGVMLHEMLTGRLPFAGETDLLMLRSIVHDDPAPLPPETPEPLLKLSRRLIEKDPEARYGTAAELAQALENLQAGRVKEKPAHPVALYLAGLALAAIALVAAGVWAGLWGPGANPTETELTVVPFTSYPGGEWGASFSPDGTRVAFSWNGTGQDNYDIYVKTGDSAALLRLTSHPAMEGSPVWSPDGRNLAFLRARPEGESELLVAPSIGGPEGRLSIVDASPWMGLSWSSDGRYVAVPDRLRPISRLGIALISVPGGRKRPLAEAPSGTVEVRNPAFSPDGKTLAFESVYSAWRGDIHLVSTAGGSPRRLTALDGLPQGLAWTPHGRHLVFAKLLQGRRSLWRVPASGGRPERIGAGVNPSHPAVAGTRLIFTERNSLSDIVRIDARDSQPASLFTSSSRFDSSPRYSPDGSRIAFASSRSGSAEIWLCDPDGSGLRRLTSAGAAGSPRWSPDGKLIAFEAPGGDHVDIYVIPASGGSSRRVTAGHAQNTLPSWSSDGRWLYFTSNRSGRLEIWKVPSSAREDRGERGVPVTKEGGLYPNESPDGKFLYYAREQRSRSSIWRMPVTGGEAEPVIQDLAAGWGSWAVTTNGIYFANRRPYDSAGDRWAVYFFDFARKSVAEAARLPKAPSSDSPGLTISPDGRTILCVQTESTADLMLAEDFR